MRRSWLDRILGAAMMLVIVAVASAFVADPPQEDGGFAPEDYPDIASKFPGGTYIPPQNSRYYRLCKDGYWWRLYPSGRIWWTETACWK